MVNVIPLRSLDCDYAGKYDLQAAKPNYNSLISLDSILAINLLASLRGDHLGASLWPAQRGPRPRFNRLTMSKQVPLSP